MAYPFIEAPTLDSFVERAQEKFGVRKTNSNIAIHGPDGLYIPEVLEREVDGKALKTQCPNLDGDERLTPHQIVRLCRRLKIPSSEWGLNLTDSALEVLGDDD